MEKGHWRAGMKPAVLVSIEPILPPPSRYEEAVMLVSQDDDLVMLPVAPASCGPSPRLSKTDSKKASSSNSSPASSKQNSAKSLLQRQQQQQSQTATINPNRQQQGPAATSRRNRGPANTARLGNDINRRGSSSSSVFPTAATAAAAAAAFVTCTSPTPDPLTTASSNSKAGAATAPRSFFGTGRRQTSEALMTTGRIQNCSTKLPGASAHKIRHAHSYSTPPLLSVTPAAGAMSSDAGPRLVPEMPLLDLIHKGDYESIRAITRTLSRHLSGTYSIDLPQQQYEQQQQQMFNQAQLSPVMPMTEPPAAAVAALGSLLGATAATAASPGDHVAGTAAAGAAAAVAALVPEAGTGLVGGTGYFSATGSDDDSSYETDDSSESLSPGGPPYEGLQAQQWQLEQEVERHLQQGQEQQQQQRNAGGVSDEGFSSDADDSMMMLCRPPALDTLAPRAIAEEEDGEVESPLTCAGLSHGAQLNTKQAAAASLEWSSAQETAAAAGAQEAKRCLQAPQAVGMGFAFTLDTGDHLNAGSSSSSSISDSPPTPHLIANQEPPLARVAAGRSRFSLGGGPGQKQPQLQLEEKDRNSRGYCTDYVIGDEVNKGAAGTVHANVAVAAAVATVPAAAAVAGCGCCNGWLLSAVQEASVGSAGSASSCWGCDISMTGLAETSGAMGTERVPQKAVAAGDGGQLVAGIASNGSEDGWEEGCLTMRQSGGKSSGESGGAGSGGCGGVSGACNGSSSTGGQQESSSGIGASVTPWGGQGGTVGPSSEGHTAASSSGSRGSSSDGGRDRGGSSGEPSRSDSDDFQMALDFFHSRGDALLPEADMLAKGVRMAVQKLALAHLVGPPGHNPAAAGGGNDAAANAAAAAGGGGGGGCGIIGSHRVGRTGTNSSSSGGGGSSKCGSSRSSSGGYAGSGNLGSGNAGSQPSCSGCSKQSQGEDGGPGLLDQRGGEEDMGQEEQQQQAGEQQVSKVAGMVAIFDAHAQQTKQKRKEQASMRDEERPQQQQQQVGGQLLQQRLEHCNEQYQGGHHQQQQQHQVPHDGGHHQPGLPPLPRQLLQFSSRSSTQTQQAEQGYECHLQMTQQEEEQMEIPSKCQQQEQRQEQLPVTAHGDQQQQQQHTLLPSQQPPQQPVQQHQQPVQQHQQPVQQHQQQEQVIVHGGQKQQQHQQQQQQYALSPQQPMQHHQRQRSFHSRQLSMDGSAVSGSDQAAIAALQAEILSISLQGAASLHGSLPHVPAASRSDAGTADAAGLDRRGVSGGERLSGIRTAPAAPMFWVGEGGRSLGLDTAVAAISGGGGGGAIDGNTLSGTVGHRQSRNGIGRSSTTGCQSKADTSASSTSRSILEASPIASSAAAITGAGGGAGVGSHQRKPSFHIRQLSMDGSHLLGFSEAELLVCPQQVANPLFEADGDGSGKDRQGLGTGKGPTGLAGVKGANEMGGAMVCCDSLSAAAAAAEDPNMGEASSSSPAAAEDPDLGVAAAAAAAAQALDVSPPDAAAAAPTTLPGTAPTAAAAALDNALAVAMGVSNVPTYPSVPGAAVSAPQGFGGSGGFRSNPSGLSLHAAVSSSLPGSPLSSSPLTGAAVLSGLRQLAATRGMVLSAAAQQLQAAVSAISGVQSTLAAMSNGSIGRQQLLGEVSGDGGVMSHRQQQQQQQSSLQQQLQEERQKMMMLSESLVRRSCQQWLAGSLKLVGEVEGIAGAAAGSAVAVSVAEVAAAAAVAAADGKDVTAVACRVESAPEESMHGLVGLKRGLASVQGVVVDAADSGQGIRSRQGVKLGPGGIGCIQSATAAVVPAAAAAVATAGPIAQASAETSSACGASLDAEASESGSVNSVVVHEGEVNEPVVVLGGGFSMGALSANASTSKAGSRYGGHRSSSSCGSVGTTGSQDQVSSEGEEGLEEEGPCEGGGEGVGAGLVLTNADNKNTHGEGAACMEVGGGGHVGGCGAEQGRWDNQQQQQQREHEHEQLICHAAARKQKGDGVQQKHEQLQKIQRKLQQQQQQQQEEPAALQQQCSIPLEEQHIHRLLHRKTLSIKETPDFIELEFLDAAAKPCAAAAAVGESYTIGTQLAAPDDAQVGREGAYGDVGGGSDGIGAAGGVGGGDVALVLQLPAGEMLQLEELLGGGEAMLVATTAATTTSSSRGSRGSSAADANYDTQASFTADAGATGVCMGTCGADSSRVAHAAADTASAPGDAIVPRGPAVLVVRGGSVGGVFGALSKDLGGIKQEAHGEKACVGGIVEGKDLVLLCHGGVSVYAVPSSWHLAGNRASKQQQQQQQQQSEEKWQQLPARDESGHLPRQGAGAKVLIAECQAEEGAGGKLLDQVRLLLHPTRAFSNGGCSSATSGGWGEELKGPLDKSLQEAEGFGDEGMGLKGSVTGQRRWCNERGQPGSLAASVAAVMEEAGQSAVGALADLVRQVAGEGLGDGEQGGLNMAVADAVGAALAAAPAGATARGVVDALLFEGSEDGVAGGGGVAGGFTGRRSLEKVVSLRLSRGGGQAEAAVAGAGGAPRLQELVRRSLSDSVGPLQQLLAQEMQLNYGEREGVRQQQQQQLCGVPAGLAGQGLVAVCGLVQLLEQRDQQVLPVQPGGDLPGLEGEMRVPQGMGVEAQQQRAQKGKQKQGLGDAVVSKMVGLEVRGKRQAYLLSVDSAADEGELLSTSLEGAGSGMIAAYRGSE